MKNKSFNRQLDIVRPSQLDFPVSVIGAGGIGSWAALALAKMGCEDITVVDFDKVEKENTPSQLYRPDQVGKLKVEALAENIRDMAGVLVSAEPKRWQEYYANGATPTKVVVCCVDSMKERIDIWRTLIQDWFKKQHFDCFIDARMGGELMRIFVVNPYDVNSLKYYEQKLHPEKKIHKEKCTAKAIAYNTLICGGVVANFVKKYAKREPTRLEFIFDIKNNMLI